MSTSPFPLDEYKAEEMIEDDFAIAIDPPRPLSPAPVQLPFRFGDLLEFIPPYTRLRHVGNKVFVLCAELNCLAPLDSPRLYSLWLTLTVSVKTSPDPLRRLEYAIHRVDVVYLVIATEEDETGQRPGVAFQRRIHQGRTGSKPVLTERPATGSYVELRSLDAKSFMFAVQTRGGRAAGRYPQYYVHLKEGGRYSLQLFTSL